MTYTGQAPTPRGYGQLYGPMAVIGFAITFVPLFEDVVLEDDGGTTTWRYDSLWVVAGTPNGGVAGVGLIVIGVLVLLLLVATFWPPQSIGLPIGITLWSLLPLIMLVTKFGTSDPPPALSDAGLFALGMLVALLLVGLAHTIHLFSRRGSPGPARLSAAEAAVTVLGQPTDQSTPDQSTPDSR